MEISRGEAAALNTAVGAFFSVFYGIYRGECAMWITKFNFASPFYYRGLDEGFGFKQSVAKDL